MISVSAPDGRTKHGLHAASYYRSRSWPTSVYREWTKRLAAPKFIQPNDKLGRGLLQWCVPKDKKLTPTAALRASGQQC